MRVASALVCIGLMSLPAPGSAGPTTWFQPPPGWTSITRKRHATYSRTWQRGEQILRFDVRPSHDSLRSIADRIHHPPMNLGIIRVISSAATSVCNGQQPAWRIVSTAPLDPGRHIVLEEILAVDGRFSYATLYMRPSTEPALPEAERAMRRLCVRGT